MKSSLRNRITSLTLCAALLLIPRPAKADSINNALIAFTAGIAAAGAAIGIGVYYALHHRNTSMTGCVALNADRLALRREGDQQIYMLVGDIGDIKAGNRIHVSGKKKIDDAGKPSFLVERVVKDYGPCKVVP